MGRTASGKLWDTRDWVDITTYTGIIANPADESLGSVSTGVNAAWADCISRGKTLVGPPYNATILITDPIVGRDLAVSNNHFPWGKPRIMAYPGTRLTFKLHPSAAGTTFPNVSETPVMRVYQQATTAGSTETYTVAYLHVISGITIDTNSVYGAFGFDLGGHQHCIAEDLEVIATGSVGGFGRLYGPGAINRNIKVTGGRYPIMFRQGSATGVQVIGCTVTGLDIVNPEGPILIQGARGSTNLNGMRITTDSTAAPIRIVASSGTASENSFPCHLDMFRCSVEYTGSGTTAVAIDNANNRGISLTDCQFLKYATIVDNIGTDLAGSSSQYHYIREYKYTPASLNGLTGYKLIDGIKTTASTITHADNATSATAVANLVESVRVETPNICDDTLFHWIDEPWNGSAGLVPETLPSTGHFVAANDLAAQMQALFDEVTAAKMRIYQPAGVWGIGSTLVPPADLVRVCGRGGTSVLAVTSAWLSSATSQAWMVDWPSDANGRGQEWYGAYQTGSTARIPASWIGAYRWRIGQNSVQVCGKLDMNANRYANTAKTVCEYSGNAGGRIYGWVDHARLNADPTTGSLSVVAGFKQLVVNAVSPIMFLHIDPELNAGNAATPWPAGTPTESVVFQRYANCILAGSKWESAAVAMLDMQGQSTDNIYISQLHSWTNYEAGSNAPLVKITSPAALNVGLMLGYYKNTVQTGEFVSASGYASGYGTANKVLRRTEFISSLQQGAVFNPAGLPKTFLYPDVPDLGSRYDSPAFDWIKVIWWSSTPTTVSGLSKFRLFAPDSTTNLATNNSKLSADGVANKGNVLDSDDSTVATAVGIGGLKYDMSDSPSRIGRVVFRVTASTANPYRIMVVARRSDNGRMRTLADLRNPAWVNDRDFTIDALAAFPEAVMWTREAMNKSIILS